MDISVVTPIFNEDENIRPLYEELTQAMFDLGRSYEIVFVDDGSTDGSHRKLRALAAVDANVKVVQFRRNYGQTAAMQAGIQHATGDYVVTIDGDRQNDPADIGHMIAKLEEGYDLIHGWRKDRKDAWLHRKLPSQIANKLISYTTGFPIHDLGCTLKVIRREIAQELELYGEMHRFIPILAHQRGARCCEVVTNHRPRVAGVTKYGIDRTFRVVLDLITVKYLTSYVAGPMQFLGKAGLWCFLVALFSLVAGVGGMSFFPTIGMAMLIAGAVFACGGIQLLATGLVAEMNTRIYYGQQQRNYAIASKLNFGDTQHEPHEPLLQSFATKPVDEFTNAIGERRLRVVAE